MRSSPCSACGQTITVPPEVEGEGVVTGHDGRKGRRVIWTGGGTLIHACVKAADPATGHLSFRQVWPGDPDNLSKLGPLPPSISIPKP
jgi:hypothetical protein